MASRSAERVVQEIEALVGASGVLTDAELVATYATDWTGRFRGRALAVVRPSDTAEVAAVLSWCSTNRVAVVPQGGNTGLVGGSIPMAGELVLSLSRLATVGAVDAAALQVDAGAGATVEAVQRAAAGCGLEYAVDLASRGTATVGGTVATNAGGTRFVRRGGTRQQLAGLEVVLADGTVLRRMSGLSKDNTGYDLVDLFCGSEGTLGVITAARLRLVPKLAARAVALVAFDSVAAAVALATRLARLLPALEAAELMTRAGMELVCEVEGLDPPFRRTFDGYLLVEAASSEDPTAELAAALDAAGVEPADTAVATDGSGRESLWAYRERHTLAIATLGAAHKLDVSLPPAELARFVGEIEAAVAEVAPGASTWLFGHAADGNVHVNVTGLQPGDDRVDDAVLRLVARRGGSISAEHGIGRAKLPWLHLSRTAGEIEVFRALKNALDPTSTLNPGVLIPPAPVSTPSPPRRL